MLSIIAIVLSYFIGSISFSVLYGKLIKGVDVRNHGSGNAGATNTLRVLGVGPAILVLALDLLKGMACVFIARAISDSAWVEVACGVMAIVGHNWPVWFKFKGGKGIATAIGVLSILVFWPALCAGVIAILTIVFTRYVSLGSLLFTILTPIFLIFIGFEVEYFIGSLIICVFAIIRHRTNVVKILKGTENKIGAKKGV